MRSQATWIADSIIQSQMAAGQNFDAILSVVEDIAVGVIMSGCYSSHISVIFGEDPKAVVATLCVNILAKMDSIPPLDVQRIMESAVRAKEYEERTKAMADKAIMDGARGDEE